jgi:hypothetical protein
LIVSVSEFKSMVSTQETDAMLELRLQGIESLIRQYTNNNFQNRNIRSISYVENSKIWDLHPLIKPNDTIQVSESLYNDGVYTYNDSLMLTDEPRILVTKVIYPADLKVGVINLLKWSLENQDKVGVSSETISRHSVTYFDQNGDNALLGYPKALTGFLQPYVKARF